MAARVISIRDFHKSQHYRDRNPPWIKLYRSLMDDPDFFGLNETQRWLYVGLMLLASECENQIPYNEAWIRYRLHIAGRLHIEALTRAKLITVGLPRPLAVPFNGNHAEPWNRTIDYFDKWFNDPSGFRTDAPKLDASLDYAVQAIGGWRRIQLLKSNPKDFPFAHREFMDAYTHHVKQRVGELKE